MSLELELEAAGGCELLLWLLDPEVEPAAVPVDVEDDVPLCEFTSLELLEVVGGSELPVLELVAGGWLPCGNVLCVEPVVLLVPVVSLVEPVVEVDAAGGCELELELWVELGVALWVELCVALCPAPLDVLVPLMSFELVAVAPVAEPAVPDAAVVSDCGMAEPEPLHDDERSRTLFTFRVPPFELLPAFEVAEAEDPLLWAELVL